MEKYIFKHVLKKQKGIQIHVWDRKEDCVRIVYLDPKSLSPLNDQSCPKRIMRFISKQQSLIELWLNRSVAV
ncbi:hypothetical protein SAMN05877753_101641 [Bacillus oleivorans]|uniref:Uncharacterized protein n=1 Tax=Bacillus oleivorans TaxID=1448271 RepID=A0A285CI95_9BACI|nr:hypothetical protein [Bacillus oleivorans]SNX67322.1 hypothetical protein SAMN05877753_101641 [Bacillus oleivorans]